MPDILACVSCDGAGCGACGWSGEWRIERCPQLEAGEVGWEALMLAEAWRKGVPPEAGGVLDQDARLLSVIEYATAERSRAIDEMGALDRDAAET